MDLTLTEAESVSMLLHGVQVHIVVIFVRREGGVKWPLKNLLPRAGGAGGISNGQLQ